MTDKAEEKFTFSKRELIERVNDVIVKECGPLALRDFNKGGIEAHKKFSGTEEGAFTDADVAVEKRIRSNLITLGNYGFVGEESTYSSASQFGKNGNTNLKKYWAVDPIDGTQAFRTGKKNWGISVGFVEEEGRTLNFSLGSVYFPCSDLLYYSDGSASYEVTNAAGNSPKKKTLKRPQLEKLIKSGAQITVGAKEQAQKYLNGDIKYSMPGGYVHQIIGVIKGDFIGSIMNVHLWDLAGCHAIGNNLGLKVYNLDRKKDTQCFKRRDFEKGFREKWKLKHTYLVCYRAAKNSILSNLR